LDKDKKLIIVGTSAFADIAYEYFEFDSQYTVVAFAAERDFVDCNTKFGLPVVAFEDLSDLYSPDDHSIYVAITYIKLNRVRTRLASIAKKKGYELASYISSNAFVWKNVKIGEHSFIFENNVVQPYVNIGQNVVIWSGNHIGHHSKIGDNCFVSSHVVISGYCEIGANTFLGVNATISNNVNISLNNWIGPNSLILQNTQDGDVFRLKNSDKTRLNSLKFFRVDE
jgi:sugar O-acyltransferase (sialic acid O-acetyltransferase NeuD family)